VAVGAKALAGLVKALAAFPAQDAMQRLVVVGAAPTSLLRLSILALAATVEQTQRSGQTAEAMVAVVVVVDRAVARTTQHVTQREVLLAALAVAVVEPVAFVALIAVQRTPLVRAA
jgi:hypothetical protein